MSFRDFDSEVRETITPSYRDQIESINRCPEGCSCGADGHCYESD